MYLPHIGRVTVVRTSRKDSLCRKKYTLPPRVNFAMRSSRSCVR